MSENHLDAAIAAANHDAYRREHGLEPQATTQPPSESAKGCWKCGALPKIGGGFECDPEVKVSDTSESLEQPWYGPKRINAESGIPGSLPMTAEQEGPIDPIYNKLLNDAFSAHTKGRMFGEEEMADAFEHFKAGFDKNYSPVAPTEASKDQA